MINFNSQGTFTNPYQTHQGMGRYGNRGNAKANSNTENKSFGLSMEAYKPSKEAKELQKANEADPVSKLSSKAQAMLSRLKERYGEDTDVFVGNWSSDEEASAIMNHGTKEYAMLISPEELEKMASDEDYAKQRMQDIDAARGDMQTVVEEAKKEGVSIDKIGFTLDADGNTKLFASLSKSSEAYKKHMEEVNKKKAEEKIRLEKKERKEAQDEKIQKRLDEESWFKTSSVEADNVEELIEKIRGINWDDIEAVYRA